MTPPPRGKKEDGGQEGDGFQVHELARVDPKGTTPDVRDITLYLPLYKPVTLSELTLDAAARLERATPYATRKPV